MAEETQDSTTSTPEMTQNEQTNNAQDPSSRKPKYEPPKSQVGKLWEAFGNPEDQANVLPGTVSNKSNSKDSSDSTLSEAFKSLSAKDLTTFYKMPCARDSLLLGIGVAFGVGGIRGILGGLRSMWAACNWAVGTFALTSLASHEFCQRRRVQELDGMKEAAELMQQLRVKRQRQKEQKLEEAARLAEDEKRRKSWTNLSNYKFW